MMTTSQNSVDLQDEPKQTQLTRDRLTVVCSVYHQHLDEDPLSIKVIQSLDLYNKAEAYSRRLKAGDKWTKLDLGWIGSESVPGYVVLENLEGPNAFVNTTKAEKEALAEKVLLITHGKDNDKAMFAIDPGSLLFTRPLSHNELYIKAAVGQVCYRLTIFPR